MTRACHTAVRMATGDAFSDAEIDDALDRMRRAYQRKKKAAPDLAARDAMAEAAGEMTREALEAALRERRLQIAAEVAKAGRRARIDAMPASMDEADRLRAFSVGSEKQGIGTALSVDAEGRALAVDLLGEVELGLRSEEGLLDRLSNFWGVGDTEFERAVAREMWLATGGQGVEPSGDAQAVHAAKVLSGALERARQMQNKAGAWIGKLEGYVGRQAHDGLKVGGGFWREFRYLAAAGGDIGEARLRAAKTAFREWRDEIRPKLNARTFDGIDPEDVGRLDEAQRLAAAGVIDDAADLEERFLYRVWSDIVTGQHEVMSGADDLGEFKAPAGKARAISKPRVLHFKDPDAWMDYHARFGRGSMLGAIMQDLERAAKNTALMRSWGPNPQAAFDNELARLVEEARARGDQGAIKKLGSQMRRAEFGELTGENNRPDNVRLAMVGRAVRLDQTLSKLGGMVLSAIGSDQALAASAFKRVGARWLDGYAGAFSGILRLQSDEAKLAADLLDAGSRSVASHLTGRFTATDGPAGWGAWASRLFYRVNGFEFVADGHRQGVASMLAAHLGQQSQFPWAGLNVGTRETLERYGLNEKAWELLRRGASEAADGRTYLTFDKLGQISNADAWAYAGVADRARRTAETAQAAREEIELRFRAMVTSFLDDTLTEPRARERVGLTRGSKPGTILGEAIRTATQFWSFNQAVLGRHLAPAARGYAGQKPVALLAHLILATTLGGFASMQAKQIVKGRTPRPLVDDDGNIDGKIWVAAMLQGGGLGIYGDFLFGEANRNGVGFSVGSLMGPGVSELEAVAQVVRSAISGDVEDLPADIVKLGVRNTPFVNLWYTRAALDYTVLWRLQEALSPGYLERYERRVEEAEGTSFFFSPSEAVQ